MTGAPPRSGRSAPSHRGSSLRGPEIRRLPPATEGELRVAVVYPSEYRVGMSNLGFHVVLELLLLARRFAVDRFFSPEGKGEARGEETGRSLAEFDALLFSVSFEPDAVGLVRMLRDARLEPLASRRRGRDPLVVAGGMAPTLNPEPLAPFCDLIGIGEAEALLPPLLERLTPRREATLEACRGLPGWYAPADGPHAVTRQHATLERPASPVVLSSDAAFGSHVDLEISRGCRWRCRFCAAGHVVTPYRELELEQLEPALQWGLTHRRRVGLVGTDVSDHRGLERIAHRVWELGGEVALPSLRVERVARRSGAAARVLFARPPRTLTLAVEASSESLRRALGKRLSPDRVLRAAALAAEAGVQQLRIYMLVGVPGERWDEVEGIVPLVHQLLEVGPPGRLTLSVNGLVPKPGTPLQWEPPPSRDYLRRARELLRRRLPRQRVELLFESPDWTAWQGLLSLSGREAAEHILMAVEQGWRRALALAFTTAPLLQEGGSRGVGGPLPWDAIQHGTQRCALLEQRQWCLERRYVPPPPDKDLPTRP